MPDDRGRRPGSVGFAAVVGAVAGATLFRHLGARGTVLGALVGAVCLGACEAVARAPN